MTTLAAFDLLLAASLVWLGWRLLASADLFEAVAGFVALGLLMALAWARLDAPDVALAEAAIGAGLMGALLLSFLGGWGGVPTPAGPGAPGAPRGGAIRVRFLLAAALGLAVAWALGTIPPRVPGLRDVVLARLPESGAENPVTAVLLGFRGYDTLLEVGVLLLAVAAVWSLGLPGAAPARLAPAGPVLLSMVRVQLPLMILLGAYLLWSGVAAPGGAFQAGVVLGAGGVLGALAGQRPPFRVGSRLARLALAGGLGVFVALAAVPPLAGRRVLEVPTSWAGPLLLVTETALTLSVAAALLALFAAARPGEGTPP
ncbi:MAG: hydrogenase subunit MbhD domain-containing protein [Deferrisomatales bacterium]|nr:hydrogenase subunit MbhD domain-containing protein [Deferrisomatales bacterium]